MVSNGVGEDTVVKMQHYQKPHIIRSVSVCMYDSRREYFTFI